RQRLACGVRLRDQHDHHDQHHHHGAADDHHGATDGHHGATDDHHGASDDHHHEQYHDHDDGVAKRRLHRIVAWATTGGDFCPHPASPLPPSPSADSGSCRARAT